MASGFLETGVCAIHESGPNMLGNMCGREKKEEGGGRERGREGGTAFCSRSSLRGKRGRDLSRRNGRMFRNLKKRAAQRKVLRRQSRARWARVPPILSRHFHASSALLTSYWQGLISFSYYVHEHPLSSPPRGIIFVHHALPPSLPPLPPPSCA